jgi:type II secretory pathway pseudopilin PulG
MPRAKKKTKGTTLVEVVVMVAMLGLVVAMFIPPIDAVRKESCVATCLANLRTISQAAAGYTAEHGSIVFAFPWGYWPDTAPPGFEGPDLATEFIWGGGLPDSRVVDWDPNYGENPIADWQPDVYVYLESERPLNEYLSPGVWWCDPERRGVGNPLRRQRPMQLPDFFKCPSDSTAAVPMGGSPSDPGDGDLPETPFPTWEWWGTSYPINWYWAYFYCVEGVPLIGSVGSEPGVLDGPWHTEILASKNDRGASEWILFYENRLNFAFEAAVPRGVQGGQPRTLQGWHGQQDTHVAGFADGSARYQYFDVRYIDGPGWTLWPNRPWTDAPWEPYEDY